MEFAERDLEWTIEDWKKVIWSDETKINHLGSDGRKDVWKDVGEALNDRVVEESEVWRWKFDDVGLHGVGWGGICNQD